MSRVTVPPFTKVSRTGSKQTPDVTSDQSGTKPHSCWAKFWGLFNRELSQSNIRSLVLSGDADGLERLIEKYRCDSGELDTINTTLWNLLNLKGRIPSQNERAIINRARDVIRKIQELGTYSSG
ncbi:MAG: hypothetical protein AABW86_04475 [Candidatus Micrarchaeota archaeon]